MITFGKFTPSSMPTVEMGFQLTCPDDFCSAKESLPLIVGLHGAGERGTEQEKLSVHGIGKVFKADPCYANQRVITLCPQCPDGLVWNNLVLGLKELIDMVVADYRVDPDRISITGLSMGGFGTWEMALTYPHFFSCAAPICGGGLSWRCNLLKEIPIRAFHGTADTVVPPEYSKLMVDAVCAAGGSAELILYEGVGHNSWQRAYEQSDLIAWMVSQSR